MDERVIEARRAARRKRILENSESRLRKICANQGYVNSVPGSASGKIKEALAFEEETKVSTSCHYPSSVERTVNGCKTKESSLSISCSADHNKLDDSESGQDFLANQLFSNLQELLQKSTFPTTDEPPQETETKALSPISPYYHRLCIICLAIFVRTILAFNLGYLFGEILLAPFLLTELSALVLAENASSPGVGSGILQLVLLIGGIVPTHTTIIIKLFNETSTLIQNLCIYLFTLVLFHVFLDLPG